MCAPFRTLCPGEGLDRDVEWLTTRAGEQAVGVAKLFAHIELRAIDDSAGEWYGQAYTDYKTGAVSLPVSETQVQMLLALATRKKGKRNGRDEKVFLFEFSGYLCENPFLRVILTFELFD
jgi:hypothetical protein